MQSITIPIIKIGGSRGIRIPKKIIEECHIENEVTATVDRGAISLAPAKKKRSGWEKAAAEIHKRGEDKPAINDTFDINDKEWAW